MRVFNRPLSILIVQMEGEVAEQQQETSHLIS